MKRAPDKKRQREEMVAFLNPKARTRRGGVTWQDIIEARDAPTHNVEGVLGTSEAMLLHIYIHTTYYLYMFCIF